jgi:hypothetical protein
MCAALTVAILCYEKASGMGLVTNGIVMGIIGLLVAVGLCTLNQVDP